MALWIKAFAMKPNDLSSKPETHAKVEKRTSPTELSSDIYTHTMMCVSLTQ